MKIQPANTENNQIYAALKNTQKNSLSRLKCQVLNVTLQIQNGIRIWIMTISGSIHPGAKPKPQARFHPNPCRTF